jgi:hypothetical protein
MNEVVNEANWHSKKQIADCREDFKPGQKRASKGGQVNG